MATLTEIDIAESRRIFELCDLNGDGFIDQDEFHVLLEGSTATSRAPNACSISRWPTRPVTATSSSGNSSPGGRTSGSAAQALATCSSRSGVVSNSPSSSS